jgi:hypothetical protein
MTAFLLALTLNAQVVAVAPVSVQQAASADPLSFVLVLAEAGIPAGLELRDADRRQASSMRPMTREQMSAEPTVPLEGVLAAFNQSHPDYRAEVVDGVVVVRPVTGRSGYLDSFAPNRTLSGQGLMRIAEKVFAPLDSRLDQPGGRIGSTLSPIGVTVDRGEGLDLAIEARGRTVLSVLNELARHGHPWLVVTSSERKGSPITRYGFAHRYRTTSEQPLQ